MTNWGGNGLKYGFAIETVPKPDLRSTFDRIQGYEFLRWNGLCTGANNVIFLVTRVKWTGNGSHLIVPGDKRLRAGAERPTLAKSQFQMYKHKRQNL